MDWTAETIERLKLLWSEGLSTAEIGRRLNISKNAVVGKAHRLALTARPSPIRRSLDAAPRPRQPILRRIQGSTLPPLAGAPELEAAQPVPSDRACDPARSETEVAAEGSHAAALVASRPDASRGDEGETGDRKDNGHDRDARGHDMNAAAATSGRVLRPVPRAATPPRPAPRNNACCWPIGEPGTAGFHFCGKTAEVGRPYCEAHVEIAYVRVRDRRDHAA